MNKNIKNKVDEKNIPEQLLWEKFPFNLKISLSLIILSGFIIRVIGINHGFSSHTVSPWSEETVIYFVLDFWKKLDFDPHNYNYPQFFMYAAFLTQSIVFLFGKLFGIFSTISDFTIHFVTDTWFFFLLARINSLIFGVSTIFAIFLLCKNYFNEKTGILAALFLAFAPLHIEHSHYYYPDVYATFFIIAAFVPIFMISITGEIKYYIIAGILVGCGAGTKYFPAIQTLHIFAAHLFFIYSKGFDWKKIIDKKLLLAAALFILFFFITTPYSFINYSELRTALSELYNRPKKWLGFEHASDSKIIFHFTSILPDAIGIPLIILGILGMCYFVFDNNKRKEGFLLISFFLIYLYLVERGGAHFANYMVAALPFLLIFSAYFLVEIFKIIKMDDKIKNIILIIISLLIIIPNAYSSINKSLYMSKTNSRIEGIEWIEKNIPSGARIVGTTYSPQILSNESIQEIINDPAYRDAKSQEILNKTILSRPIYRFERLPWSPQYYNLDLLKKYFDYIIIDSGMYGRHQAAPEYYPVHIKFYNDLDKNYKLLKQIDGEPKIPGPTIKIYKVIR